MTPIAGKREAQQRADSIRVFRAELARLEREGVLVLSEEQRLAVNHHAERTLAALAEQFDIDLGESQKQVSWAMRIASTIGGLALCASVVLFFYRFWGALATPAQVAVLAAGPVALVFAADFAARRERTLYFASLIATVAFAAFVLNLNVLGAIFNLTPSPGAFLAWGLFGLALGWHLRVRLPLAAGVVCLMIWLAAVVTSWTGSYWGGVMDAPEPLILAGTLVVAAGLMRRGTGAEFPALFVVLGMTATFVAMLALSSRAASSYLPLSAQNAGTLYQFLGMLASAAAIRYGIARGFQAMVNLAAGFFVVFLYVRLAQWWWDWMPKYLFFLIIGFLSLGLLAAFRKLRSRLVEGRAV